MLKPVKLPGTQLVIRQNVLCQPVTSASALLVDYTLARHQEDHLSVLELGSGCGIVSIMLKLKRPSWDVCAIELQPEEVILSHRNAIDCGIDLEIWQDDIRHFRNFGDVPDLIVSNPPWVVSGRGRPSPQTSRRIGREELCCTMDQLLVCLYRNLGRSSEAILIYPSGREEELKEKAAKSSLDIIDSLRSTGAKSSTLFCLKKTC